MSELLKYPEPGSPIYITVDERKKVYSTYFSFDPALEKQRDIFVFQCLVGCRISELYRMTKHSIIDGAVEYMPRKTKDGNPVVERVPLLTAQMVMPLLSMTCSWAWHMADAARAGHRIIGSLLIAIDGIFYKSSDIIQYPAET